MKFLKMKYLQTHGLIQKKITDININELLEIQHKQLLPRVERWTCEGSCWTIHSVLQHRLVISGIAPCGESPYFSLPKDLRNPMKGLINSKSEDKECFR